MNDLTILQPCWITRSRKGRNRKQASFPMACPCGKNVSKPLYVNIPKPGASTSPSHNCLSKPAQVMSFVYSSKTHLCSLSWESVWGIGKREIMVQREIDRVQGRAMETGKNFTGTTTVTVAVWEHVVAKKTARDLRQHSLALDPFSLELDAVTLSMVCLSTGWNQVAITHVISASNAVYH